VENEAHRVLEVMGRDQFESRAGEILDALARALPAGDDIGNERYGVLLELVRRLGGDLTSMRATPAETAAAVLSLREVLVGILGKKFRQKQKFDAAMELARKVVDKLALLTFDTYVGVKEELIREQQLALTETAAPVVKVWDRVLMVPLVGIIDSERTQLVMDRVLEGIEQNQARVVLLDITGIPAVDTLVARHLISTVTAVRLMGAECVVTGISSRIAQTVVQMGIDLEGINTKATLADGLREALSRLGLQLVSKAGGRRL